MEGCIHAKNLYFLSPIVQLLRRTSRKRARNTPKSGCTARVATVVATHTYLFPALHACKTNHATGTSSYIEQSIVWR